MINNFQQLLTFFNDYHEEIKKSMESIRIKKLETENAELQITYRDIAKRLNAIE